MVLRSPPQQVRLLAVGRKMLRKVDSFADGFSSSATRKPEKSYPPSPEKTVPTARLASGCQHSVLQRLCYVAAASYRAHGAAGRAQVQLRLQRLRPKEAHLHGTLYAPFDDWQGQNCRTDSHDHAGMPGTFPRRSKIARCRPPAYRRAGPAGRPLSAQRPSETYKPPSQSFGRSRQGEAGCRRRTAGGSLHQRVRTRKQPPSQGGGGRRLGSPSRPVLPNLRSKEQARARGAHLACCLPSP